MSIVLLICHNPPLSIKFSLVSKPSSSSSVESKRSMIHNISSSFSGDDDFLRNAMTNTQHHPEVHSLLRGRGGRSSLALACASSWNWCLRSQVLGKDGGNLITHCPLPGMTISAEIFQFGERWPKVSPSVVA